MEIEVLKNMRSERNQEETPNMVHILFSPSHAGGLKEVLKNLDVQKEERVISFWAMFSVGPIWKLHEERGKEARLEWIKNSLNYSLEEFKEYESVFHNSIKEIEWIPEGIPITIWSAENSHEQSGLRYVLHMLKGKNNKINVINTTKMYVKHLDQTEKKHVVLHTGEISPEKLQVIYVSNQNQPLSQLERERYELDWLKLSDNRDSLRIWQHGEIKNVPEDFYDSYMINMAKKLHSRQKAKEYMNSARLIGEVLSHLDQYVGDEFLEYRLRAMIEKGIFEFEGSLESMRYYSVKWQGRKGDC